MWPPANLLGTTVPAGAPRACPPWETGSGFLTAPPTPPSPSPPGGRGARRPAALPRSRPPLPAASPSLRLVASQNGPERASCWLTPLPVVSAQARSPRVTEMPLSVPLTSRQHRGRWRPPGRLHLPPAPEGRSLACSLPPVGPAAWPSARGQPHALPRAPALRSPSWSFIPMVT